MPNLKITPLFCLSLIGATLAPGAMAEAQDEDEQPVVRLVRVENKWCFEAALGPAERDWLSGGNATGDVIAVFLVRDGETAEAPLLGRVQRIGESVRFVPRFSLREGTRFQVLFGPSARQARDGDVSGVVRGDLVIPADSDAKPTEIEGVFPSQSVLPENLLRFYIQFSAPMRRGEMYQRTRLVDADDREIEFAFLELDEELWNGSVTRATILFDPGRVKRELRPREDVGSPLREGRRFALVIDGAWKDSRGRQLAGGKGWRHEFEVGPHDERCPDPARWRLTAPSADSRQPLRVEFDEPLDYGMLQRVLVPLDAAGKPVPGTVAVGDDQASWRFVPDVPWRAGHYRLRIATVLEDRAGNSIQRPFEVDLTKEFESSYPNEFTMLPFVVK